MNFLPADVLWLKPKLMHLNCWIGPHERVHLWLYLASNALRYLYKESIHWLALHQRIQLQSLKLSLQTKKISNAIQCWFDVTKNSPLSQHSLAQKQYWFCEERNKRRWNTIGFDEIVRALNVIHSVKTQYIWSRGDRGAKTPNRGKIEVCNQSVPNERLWEWIIWPPCCGT